jgi:hypothetical protein
MQQRPSWEANGSSASQEISYILWILKVHHLIQKRQLPVPILSQKNQLHAFSNHFLKIPA